VELKKLLEHETAGDPITGVKWARVTPDRIAALLRKRLKIEILGDTVATILKDLDYSLKANRKMVSAQKSPERNEQFRIISNFRDMFTDAADPIISVDTKKKELVGNFKNPGRRWENDETPVNDHDFLSLAKC